MGSHFTKTHTATNSIHNDFVFARCVLTTTVIVHLLKEASWGHADKYKTTGTLTDLQRVCVFCCTDVTTTCNKLQKG